jgi:hypothetical protein
MIDTLLAAQTPSPTDTVTATAGATTAATVVVRSVAAVLADIAPGVAGTFPSPSAPAVPAAGVVREAGTLRVVAVLSTFLLSSLLGVVIAWKAYAGYAATRSKPMLFLAVGVVLLTAVPALLSTVLTNFTVLPAFLVVLVTNGAEILGLLAIAYSLYGRF